MHEMGMVSGILEVARATARHEGALRVLSVRVRIGDLREAVPDALDFAWEVLRDEDELTAAAELVVEEVHPRSSCSSCGAVFDHDRFHVRCPVCGSSDTRLLRGRELDIVSIDIETPDETEARPSGAVSAETSDAVGAEAPGKAGEREGKEPCA